MNEFMLVGLIICMVHAFATLVFTVANQFGDYKEGIFYSSAFCVGSGIVALIGLLIEYI